VWKKSGVELGLTHRYIAGVMYMNDSVVGTALAGPSARARVATKATHVNAIVLKDFIMEIPIRWKAEGSNKMLVRDNNQ
jgi:hypothetical protein